MGWPVMESDSDKPAKTRAKKPAKGPKAYERPRGGAAPLQALSAR